MQTYGLESLGIIHPIACLRNLPPAKLVEAALKNGEGVLSDTGALVVETGKYTGRSPDDKFIVDCPALHDRIAWGKVNRPITPQAYDRLYEKIIAYLQNRSLYLFDGFAGADPAYRMGFRIINELACQNLFIHQLLIRPTPQELNEFKEDFTIIVAPGFRCIPERDGTHSEAAILVHYEKRQVLIAGSQYAGEIKKSVFSVMNYFMPEKNVFPMHCAANMGAQGDTSLFFGLSGTGKTTLSADPSRKLIGDDEHGWSDDGIFNFEGGCYAKCINLSKENEPQIWDAIKFGSLVENVVLDPHSRTADYDDDSLTENTRAAYPVDFIPNAAIPGVGGQPKTVVFLTADAFGVLPPIARLDKNMAMYHFVSGYTSKLAGTERGITEPQATFSTCFGAPFLPLAPSLYAEMLGRRIDLSDARVYLINTGWSGGPYGVGKRMRLRYTRAMVTAALSGTLDNVPFVLHPIFNIHVPTACPDVPSEILDPRNTWSDKNAYDQAARNLAARFVKNFEQYTHMPKEVINAGPKA